MFRLGLQLETNAIVTEHFVSGLVPVVAIGTKIFIHDDITKGRFPELDILTCFFEKSKVV